MNEIGVGGARALGDALKTNTTLTQLDLNSEQQDHKEAQRGKYNGTWCDWADNEIGDEGACGLGDALKTNTTMTELDLRCEQQDELTAHSTPKHKHHHQADNGLGREGREAVWEALQANTALTSLLM